MMWTMFCFMILTFSNKNFFFLSEEFLLDTLNYSLLFLSPFMIFLCFEAVFHSMNKNKIWKSLILVFFLVLFMTISFICTSMMGFLIFLEMSIIPIVYLILIFSKLEDKIEAAWSMFFFNILGSSPFLILIGVDSNYKIKSLTNLHLEIFAEDCVFLIILFLPLLCFKIPIFLSHFWLTKAHVSAAGFCSMILASLSLKLGSFGLLKFIHLFKISSMKILSFSFAWACIGFLLFNFFMIRYIDVKYYVAVSSLLHMSFILPSCLFTKSSGCFGALLMMISHGLISPFFFLIITVFYESLNSRSLDINKSVESVSKFISMILICCLLLNLGVPPFMMFFSELEILKFICSFSVLCTFIFLSGMMVSIVHFMFFCSKCIYGKKNILLTEDISYNVLMMFYFLIISLTMTLFSF